MKYQYDYDVKDELMALLTEKANFSGVNVLSHYMEVYRNEKNPSTRNLIKFCIYKLSARLSDRESKNFDCDVSRGVIESFPQIYSWLKNSVIEHQMDRNGNVIPMKYQLRTSDTVFRGDTMTSIWTTLKEYVNLKDKYSEYTTVPAYIIERSISNYEKIVVINAGTDDGIQVNMPVISESGLVGYVISTTSSTAKVQTIIDTASNVSANISNVEDSVILKGTLNNIETVRATYIPADSTILQGDQVVTSGLGGIYPKGILIGTVKSVVNTKNEADRYAEIEVSTDFSRLETVLVITEN